MAYNLLYQSGSVNTVGGVGAALPDLSVLPQFTGCKSVTLTKALAELGATAPWSGNVSPYSKLASVPDNAGLTATVTAAQAAAGTAYSNATGGQTPPPLP